jgi:hypothetical protein
MMASYSSNAQIKLMNAALIKVGARWLRFATTASGQNPKPLLLRASKRRFD